MQYQFAPWRKDYMQGGRTPGCFLCQGVTADPATWPAIHVLHRDAERLVILNRFPYNTGHLLIAPAAHVATPVDTSPALAESLARALRAGLEILQKSYQPQGLNAGLNLGNAAGAGVTDHYHWHLLPRWGGDSNFMGVLADTRVLSETLDETYTRLRPLFAAHPEFSD
jgi:ATP adenylyltransferase